MRTEGESSVIITACACLVQFALLAQVLSSRSEVLSVPGAVTRRDMQGYGRHFWRPA
jgi:hypothetical protein